MRSWLAVVALLLVAAAAVESRVVLNHAKVMAEPRFWSRNIGEVERGQKVRVHGESAGWVQVELNGRRGFVPEGAFVDTTVGRLTFRTDPDSAQPASAAQAANASRGFSQEANAQDVSQQHLEEADAWIAKYEREAPPSLGAALAAQMPGFVADGHLDAPAPTEAP